MSAWSKVRPIHMVQTKDGGVSVAEFPEYVAITDAVLAEVDAQQATARDGEYLAVTHRDHWLTVRAAEGVGTYRLLIRDGAAGLTLAQRAAAGFDPDTRGAEEG